jgi:hypothetical protein
VTATSFPDSASNAPPIPFSVLRIDFEPSSPLIPGALSKDRGTRIDPLADRAVNSGARSLIEDEASEGFSRGLPQ